MADTYIHLKDDKTAAYFHVKLTDNLDGTYTADLNPFMYVIHDLFSPLMTVHTSVKIEEPEREI